MSSGIVESSNQQQQQNEQQGQGQQASRSKLVQRLLAASSNLPAFVNDLLTTQAVSVAGTEAAAFLLEKQGENFGLKPIAHVRPDNAAPEIRQQAITAFQEIVRPCVAQNKDGAIEIGQPSSGGEMQFCLVTLLRSEQQVVGVSAVITRCLDTERAKQRLMSMQLVAGYFELYSLRRTSEHSRTIAQSHQHVLQLATSVATGEGFEAASQSLCNELATRTGAARVSLGWVKGKNVKVVALSHTEKFDKKQEVITQIQNVMEECADQEIPVQYDPSNEETTQAVTREAQIFSRSQGGNIVLSLPLRRREEIEGVVTLEFLPQHKLGENAATGLTIAVDLLAPQLYDRYQNDRWLITKAGLSARNVMRATLGPKHWIAKTVTTLILAGVIFICVYKMEYRVTAPFSFVTDDKRQVSAPFEGYVDSVPDNIRPGAIVKKGDVLLTLDTYDLVNKREEALAEARGKQAEMAKARAEDKQADANIAEADYDRAMKQAEYFSRKIEQSTIKADIEGRIMAGDWVDKKGVAVKLGEPLYEIGNLTQLKGELSVADRDVQWLDIGQKGKLATTTLPGDKYPFVVDRIVPKGDAKEGENVFTVRVALDRSDSEWPADGHHEGWLPGLTGEAKIVVAKKPIVWIWTHRLVEWVRLKAWM